MIFLPKIAQAATSAEGTINSIVPKIVDAIVMPVITVVFMVAILYFVWGVTMFMINSSDPDKREQGRKHILWGIIGLVIMVSVFGIIRLVANTVGQNVGF